jgi:hypothetical protein
LLIGRARSTEALAFYHSEALRGGWSVRQLDRQIASQFYERTVLSRNKAAMLKVLARDYRLALPNEKRLATEIEQTRERLEVRRSGKASEAKQA